MPNPVAQYAFSWYEKNPTTPMTIQSTNVGMAAINQFQSRFWTGSSLPLPSIVTLPVASWFDAAASSGSRHSPLMHSVSILGTAKPSMPSTQGLLSTPAPDRTTSSLSHSQVTPLLADATKFWINASLLQVPSAHWQLTLSHATLLLSAPMMHFVALHCTATSGFLTTNDTSQYLSESPAGCTPCWNNRLPKVPSPAGDAMGAMGAVEADDAGVVAVPPLVWHWTRTLPGLSSVFTSAGPTGSHR